MRVSSSEFDVVIVGAGTAGSACALAMANAGLAVGLLDKRCLPQPLLGECLSPMGYSAALSLGVRDFGRHQRLAGYVSAWGGEPAYRDAMPQAHGPAWLLDRAAFDADLQARALDAGAMVWRIDRMPMIDRLEGAWRVGTGERQVVAPVLVDATGRSVAVGRRLGAKRLTASRCVAHTATYEGGGDACIVVESCEAGWWYTACTSTGPRVVTLFTEQLCTTRVANSWDSLVRQTNLVSERIAARRRTSAIRAVSSNCYQTRPFVGRGWLAVGDAALTVDPLSGSGISNALEMAVDAARAICSGGVELYHRKWTCSFANHVLQREQFYYLARL